MSAVLGGTQSLHANSFGGAMALPTGASARIASNTQRTLQEETGITHVADPLAGRHYVASLTGRLAEQGWTLIEDVEGLGGMTRDVASAMPKLRIEESAAFRQAVIDRGTGVIIGVNKYQPETDHPVDILSIDNLAVRDGQIARLKAIFGQGTNVPKAAADILTLIRSLVVSAHTST
jgi:methylmalonyl-CoA mutase